MNRRTLLKLSSASLASLALPGLRNVEALSNPGLPVEAVFESSTQAGRRFGAVLATWGIDTHPVERDVSGLWYEHLTHRLESPAVLLGLTREPEAFYLKSFAREKLHHCVVELAVSAEENSTEIRPQDLKTGLALPEPLPCEAPADWPALLATVFAEQFCGNPGFVRHAATESIAGPEPLTTWVIAPINYSKEYAA